MAAILSRPQCVKQSVAPQVDEPESGDDSKAAAAALSTLPLGLLLGPGGQEPQCFKTILYDDAMIFLHQMSIWISVHLYYKRYNISSHMVTLGISHFNRYGCVSWIDYDAHHEICQNHYHKEGSTKIG